MNLNSDHFDDPNTNIPNFTSNSNKKLKDSSPEKLTFCKIPQHAELKSNLAELQSKFKTLQKK